MNVIYWMVLKNSSNVINVILLKIVKKKRLIKYKYFKLRFKIITEKYLKKETAIKYVVKKILKWYY